ncbi:MAG: M3 family metallopeptidase [Candidatus Devosia phytovorans]|uniref:M3 family metallopeptidase n=1 Tax=Candidatus Devosia phytovorans TaxID=3121372 RepID=A0AAJ5VYN9_9HYPH|nr:M3 family metallopeptidase [Devosia sp.]WEK06436.1 MAG: M3 family metallopeptidase [Devosia sp.]
MTNPLLSAWTTPHQTPPFNLIETTHFQPAFDAALDEHRAEIAAIAQEAAAPSFDNTVLAMERSGQALKRVSMLFGQLTSAATTPELQAVEREVAVLLARHESQIFLNADLFARIDALHRDRDQSQLDAEALRVLERYHLDFTRAGARLDADERARFAGISERLATLGTQFGQNVLADEDEGHMAFSASDMDGLPEFARSAAAETARSRGLEQPFAITPSRSSVEPVLHFASNRDVREQVWRAFIKRGANGNKNDNAAVIAEIVALRAEQARLLGYASYADYKLDDTMAGSPAAARALLEQVWAGGKARAERDRDALQDLATAEGQAGPIEAWDWRYYAEKLRVARYDFDENELKPYLQLEKVVEAGFFVAGKLFGLTFTPRSDIAGYHPDVAVWEVTRGGKVIGLFYGDYFARSGKRSGAWMTSFREQAKLDGAPIPLIVNTCNFVKPPAGQPALLSLDEARTVFHEMGHGLHGLLSDVTYPRLAGTNVARDFVELPSQIYEHWMEEPQVLARFTHVQTGEPIPADLLERMHSARTANSGFETVEFVSSAILDMDYHSQPMAGSVADFEKSVLDSIGMPREIALRHASTHFLHLFSGDGYAAGYYSYLWSEVLDADGFGAFKEAGDPFDPKIAARLHEYIYSAGGKRDFAEAYRLFRGRDPEVKALLEGRGI